MRSVKQKVPLKTALLAFYVFFFSCGANTVQFYLCWQGQLAKTYRAVKLIGLVGFDQELFRKFYTGFLAGGLKG